MEWFSRRDTDAEARLASLSDGDRATILLLEEIAEDVEAIRIAIAGGKPRRPQHGLFRRLVSGGLARFRRR
jgi:hypothetical protein